MTTLKRHLLPGAGLLLAAICLLMKPVWADVMIKQEGTMEGLGGIMNSEIMTVTCIKGDMKCDESEMRMTNKMMKLMGGGKPVKTASIIRLDKGVVWNVNHKEKSYTEMSLKAMGEMAGQFAESGMAGGEMEGMAEDQDFDTSKYTMSPPKFSVEKTGKKEKIAGYECEQSILTMEVEGEEKDTGNKFKMIIVMDMMLTPDVPGMAEINGFNQKMAEKMGFDLAGGLGGSFASALNMYGLDSEELREQAAGLEGFALRTIATFKGDGGQFEMTANEDEDGEDGEGDDDGQNAAAAKMLKGLFGGGDKKDDDKSGESGELMKMTLEIKDISNAGIDEATFEPPAKYKLVKLGDDE